MPSTFTSAFRGKLPASIDGLTARIPSTQLHAKDAAGTSNAADAARGMRIRIHTPGSRPGGASCHRAARFHPEAIAATWGLAFSTSPWCLSTMWSVAATSSGVSWSAFKSARLWAQSSVSLMAGAFFRSSERIF